MDFPKDIRILNNRLKEKGIKLRVEQRGKFLYFRGPLPCKDNKLNKKVQRISLGLYTNIENVKKAEQLLKLLLLQIELGQFEWSNWERKKNIKIDSNEEYIQENISKFKSYFFSKPSISRVNSSKLTTWNSSYKPYLNRLEKLCMSNKESLNKRLLEKTIESYEQNSRSKQQCATVMNIFAEFINLKLPTKWKKIGSGYGINKYNFRHLPNDKEIIRIWDSIPNEKWKLVFGIMAIYGLRNHEVFFSDYSNLDNCGEKIVRVLPTTKTGEHQVWPFHQEWFDLFKLQKISDIKNNLPNINTNLNETTLQKVGRRVTEQFKRYNLPIKPYDLRHAWAIRTIHIGLPDTVAARMMGHSVSIHNKTYHHWITTRDQQKAVDQALSK